jgi:endonuclease/exonuclease/phosphatase family metal-dependent hydrolase
VAQFNVLADGLSGNDELKGGFTEVPLDALDWSYRAGRLVEELVRHGEKPDVISLQEVDHFHDWFEPALARLGYEGRFMAKPNSKCKYTMDPNLEDGCAIFWRKSTMSLKHLDTLNYDSCTDEGDLDGKKDNQVAVVARLQPRGAAAPVTVAVTHLASKKSSWGERKRMNQLKQLLSHLEAQDTPCVIAGDLNAAPRHSLAAPYEPQTYDMAMKHPLRLQSAYREVLGHEPEWTTWKRRGEKEAFHTIDYILASEAIKVNSVLLPPPTTSVHQSRLPGWQYPSDHVALMADIVLPPLAQPAPAAALAAPA